MRSLADKTLMVMDGYGTIKEVTCITDVFRGVPLPVDAAEVINGELYIFKVGGHSKGM